MGLQALQHIPVRHYGAMLFEIFEKLKTMEPSEERDKLAYGVNTILISPRRMGKTSLVDKVCSLVESEDIRIARIDAFGCRSENDFINAFATAVVRATSSK